MTVYYKMRQTLLQNASAILLQNAAEVYYKMRQVFCYKFTKCDSYYNMRRLLQIATVQTTFYSKCPLLLQIVNVIILRSLSSLCVRKHLENICLHIKCIIPRRY